MSLDPSLAAQRQMLRDKWARDAAMRCPALPGSQLAVLQVPDQHSDPGAQEHSDTLAREHVRQGPADRAQAGPEPEVRSVPQISARARWECPEALPDGQRQVLGLLHAGRVGMDAVLCSRDPDAQALRVRYVLDADRRTGSARAGQIMEAAGVGDSVTVNQLAPVHVERLLAAAVSLP